MKSKGAAEIAFEIGDVTPSLRWPESVGTKLPDGARPKR